MSTLFKSSKIYAKAETLQYPSPDWDQAEFTEVVKMLRTNYNKEDSNVINSLTQHLIK